MSENQNPTVGRPPRYRNGKNETVRAPQSLFDFIKGLHPEASMSLAIAAELIEIGKQKGWQSDGEVFN